MGSMFGAPTASPSAFTSNGLNPMALMALLGGGAAGLGGGGIGGLGGPLLPLSGGAGGAGGGGPIMQGPAPQPQGLGDIGQQLMNLDPAKLQALVQRLRAAGTPVGGAPLPVPQPQYMGSAAGT